MAIPSLSYLEEQVRKHLWLPEHSYTLLPPWIVHTWVYMSWPWTPYLLVQSPTQECGKSTLVDFLAAYCYKPFVSCNGTAAAIARLVADQRGTLIVDEWDSLTHEARSTYFSILNSGFKETGNYLRCDGEDNVPKFFATYCPKVIVGVSGTRIPNTTLSRCLPFYMEPLPPGVKPKRLYRYEDKAFRADAQAWAGANATALYGRIPDVPDTVAGRDRDIWEPLFAVCDALGEADWSTRIRNLPTLLDKAVEPSDNTGVRLLATIWQELNGNASGKGAVCSHTPIGLFTHQILAMPGVLAMGMDPKRLAITLKPFNARPKDIRVGDRVAKGYLMVDLQRAFVAHRVERIEIAASGVGGGATSATSATTSLLAMAQ